MPIPTPHKHEAKQAFVSRCIAAIHGEHKDNPGQAAAICYRSWQDHKANAAYVVQAGGDEYAFAKEPIDSDIEKRRKTAGDPPAGAITNPTPKAGKPEKVNSMDDGKPVDPASMQWFLAYEKDPQTGLAKWPLSFKRIERDVKRPGKPAAPNATHPGKPTPEQPARCV